MRYLLAVASAMTVCAATSIVAAAQSADTPALPQVRPGGLLANRSPDAVIDLARNNAAEQAGVSPDQVSVVNVQPVEWPNFALGCPNLLPRFSVAEVTVPGFIVELDVAGTPVVYHTDSGLRAIPCEAPPAPSPTSD
jgi:hypothetical protein